MSHITYKELPYKENQLNGFLSKKSFEYHYHKHYKGYITKLNNLIVNTKYHNMSLQEIINNSSGGVYNNAAQIFNHEFFFDSITPAKQEIPLFIKNHLAQYSSINEFLNKFYDAATLFGSGWIWIVYDKNKCINIMSTQNAIIPKDVLLLAVCDVWEHAYYIDYYNDRSSYVKKFIEHLNWNKIVELIKNHT